MNEVETASTFSVDQNTILVLPSSSETSPRFPALLDAVLVALREIDGLNVLPPDRALPLIEEGIPEEHVSGLLGAGQVLLLELQAEGDIVGAQLLDGATGAGKAYWNRISVSTTSDWTGHASAIAHFVLEHWRPAVREHEIAEAQAIVLNTAISDLERITALMRVPRAFGSGDRPILPEEVVIAAADMATASIDPSTRRRVWTAMKGVGHPYLVKPLIRSLVSDSDERVRIAAAITLEDFAHIPEVRAALTRTRDADVSADVRARASDSLMTEKERRSRALRTFQDESLANPRP